MRILRLDLGDGIGTVDLHPFISVLHDLDPVQANTLVSTVRSLVNGSGNRVRGLIENDGHLVELGDLSSQSIGPLTTEDVVVEVDRLAGTPAHPEAALAELDQLRRRAEIDAVMVEEIRADLEPSVAARVFQLQERLRDAAGGGSALIQARISRVADCIASVDAEPASFTEVPEQIQDLISGWESYCVNRHAAAGHLEGLHKRIQVAESALAQSMQHLADAREKAKPVLLSAMEDSRLEELVNPSDKKRRTRELSDDERSEVAALLGKVGMPTYTAYALHRLSPAPPADQVAVLDQAKNRLAAAHRDAEEARSAFELDSTASGLELQFDAVKVEARLHLGPMLPGDLGAALTELVIEIENPAWLDALRALYDLLLHEGIDVPEEVEPEQLVDHARTWVDRVIAELAAADVVDPAVVAAELVTAERDFARHARAMVRIDQFEAQAVASAARVVELEASAAATGGATAGGAIGPIVEMLTALAHRLRGENSRSVPIVVAGEFAGVSDDEIGFLMSQLEALAQQHQLILATNRHEVAAWSTTVGLRRALRSTPSRVSEN